MFKNNFNSNMIKILGDIIRNELPIPSKDPKKVSEAIKIGDTSMALAQEGRTQMAIKFMIKALRMGVPEPMNGQLKVILMTLIDRQINHNIVTNRNKKKQLITHPY